MTIMRASFISYMKNLQRGVAMVAFPEVCCCCGLETTEAGRQICPFCRDERFELANHEYSSSSDSVLLPEYVFIQHALWKFDQGGTLQSLLHHLKYEHLADIGVELGSILGVSMQKHPEMRERLSSEKVVLVPVPLHYLKFRKRGFNQAFMIARGVRQKWNFPICEINSVIRIKNTRTQTGFSLKKRIANMRDAFQVKQPEAFRNTLAVIVDDVFTTGSTTFELARTLKETGCNGVIIVTVAQA